LTERQVLYIKFNNYYKQRIMMKPHFSKWSSGSASLFAAKSFSIEKVNSLLRKLLFILGMLMGASSPAFSQTGTHLKFDGVDDRITLPNQPLANLNTFTLEAMVFTTSNTQQTIYAEGNTGSNNPFFSISKMSTGFEITLRNVSAVGLSVPTTTGSIPLNTWTHVAFVRTSATTASLYINGVNTDNFTFADPGAIAVNVTNLGVRQRAAIDGYSYLNGSLDEVRLWNTALTANNISRRRFCELQGNEPGLIQYYKFNQGTGGGANAGITSLNGATAVPNNGTLVNFALSGTNSNWLAGSPVTTGSIVPAAPSTVPTTQTICGIVAGLTPAPGTTINWYNTATGGTALPASDELITGTYYVAAVNASGCESERIAVNVTATSTTPAPTANAQSLTCGATVANLVATGTALRWYNTPTGGTALPAATVLLTGTYYVSQTINNCQSPRTAVSVTINTSTPPPSTSAQSFCGTGTVANLTATGTDIRWYAAATGGTALAGTTVLTTATTYYASQTVSGCESVTRAAALVTLLPLPAGPGAINPQIYAGTATIANLTATGANIKWYATAIGGTALASTTALADGATYYASQTVGSCEGARTAVTVRKISEAAQTVCDGGTVASLVSTPSPGATTSWFTSAMGGNILPPNTPVSAGTYYIEQKMTDTVTTLVGGPGVFNLLRGIAVEADGKMVLVDMNSNRILRANADGSNLQLITNNTSGPIAIAIQNDGKLIVSENIGGRVSRYNSDGNGKTVLNYFSSPAGIAIQPDGKIIIVDRSNSAIKRMNADGSGLVTLYSGINGPWGVAVQPDGKILVTSDITHTLYRMNADGTGLQTLGSGFNNPFGVAVQPDGKIIIGDYGNFTVKRMNADGTDIETLGSGIGRPGEVTVRPDGKILVEDNAYWAKLIALGGKSNRVAVTVTLSSSIAPPTAAAQTFCDTATVANLVATGTNIKWYAAATGGAALASTTALVTGTYYASQTLNGCESVARAAAAVTINPLPATPTVTANGPVTFCSGGNVTLTSSAGNTYLWSTGATTQSIVVTASGSYTVRVTGANSCQSAVSTPITVTVNAIAAIPVITASGPTALCTGESVTLHASRPSPLDNISTAALAVGLHKLKSSYNGPALRLRRSSDNAQQDFGFLLYDLDTAAIRIWLNGASGFCTTLYDQSGSGNHVTQATATNQPLYVANGLNGKPILRFTTSQRMYNLANFPAPYSVVYGARQTGGSRQRVLASRNNNWILGWVNGKKQQAYFEGWVHNPNITADDAPAVYSATGSGTLSSLYENGNLIVANNAGLAGPNGIGLNGGYTGTSEFSTCEFTDVFVFSSVLSNANRNAVEAAIGGYYNIPVTSSIVYQWSNGATTPSITVSTAGSYTVQVTSPGLCQSASSAATTVTVGTAPAATPTITAGGATTFCLGDSVLLTSSAATGYLWSNGATTQSIYAKAAGNYTVRITDVVGGCLSNAAAPVAVTVNGVPATPTVTAGGPVTFCPGGSVTLTSSAGTAYLWSNGATTQSIVATAAGSYMVRISNGACLSTPSAPIAVTLSTATATPAIMASGPTAICGGQTVTLYVPQVLPLDSVSTAALATGLRKLRSAYTGPALRLRRASDNAQQDFGFWGNDLDTAAIALWLNGNSGYCTTLYDQSGSGRHVTQATDAKQPLYVANGINGKPVLRFNTSQNMFNSTNFPPPFSVVYAAKQTGPVRERVFSGMNNNWFLGWHGGSRARAFFGGWVGGATFPTNDNPYIYSATCTGSLSTVYENGTSYASNNAGVQGPNGIGLNGGFNAGAVETSNCDFTDVFVFTSALSNANRNLVEATTGQYYNIPVSGSTPAPSYLWSNGAATSGITVATAGSYSVQVTRSGFCQSLPSAPIVVTTGALPSIGADTTIYHNCLNETTNLLPLYNTTGLITTWNTATPTVVVPGNYRLVVNDATGCTDTAFVNIVLEKATWTGSVSGDWHTAGNWSTGKVPTDITHVVIPAGTPNACTIGTVNATVASVQLKTGAVLNATGGARIFINGKCVALPPVD
jgi:large repetitive protein